MDKLIENLRNAVSNLKTVANGMRIPLDTRAVEKALDELLAASGKNVEFGARSAAGVVPDDVPAQDPEPEVTSRRRAAFKANKEAE